MKEELQALATSMAGVAEQLRAFAESQSPLSTLDPKDMSAEDRDKLKDLVNIWVNWEIENKFATLVEGVDKINTKIDDLESGLESEIRSVRDDMPSEIGETDREALLALLSSLNGGDGSELVRHTDLPDFDDFVRTDDLDTDDVWKKSEHDPDEFVRRDSLDELDILTKGDVPDFSDYDLDDIRDAANKGESAYEDLSALEARVQDLEKKFETVVTLTSLLDLLGVSPQAMKQVVTRARTPVLVAGADNS